MVAACAAAWLRCPQWILLVCCSFPMVRKVVMGTSITMMQAGIHCALACGHHQVNGVMMCVPGEAAL